MSTALFFLPKEHHVCTKWEELGNAKLVCERGCVPFSL